MTRTFRDDQGRLVHVLPDGTMQFGCVVEPPAHEDRQALDQALDILAEDYARQLLDEARQQACGGVGDAGPCPTPPVTGNALHGSSPVPLRVVCAWCSRLMKDGPPDPVSHGLCPECEAVYFP